VLPSDSITAFVTFPGVEIKDLLVHEDRETLPTPPVQNEPENKKPIEGNRVQNKHQQNDSLPPKPPVNESNKDKAANKPRSYSQRASTNNSSNYTPSTANRKESSRQPATYQQNNQTSSHNNNYQRHERHEGGSGAGTGQHLLKLKERKAGDGQSSKVEAETTGDFDFQAGLNIFKKDEVLAKVAESSAASNTKSSDEIKEEIKYKKEDFFDSLSCDLVDREEGRRTRMTFQEERVLNQDTFGAIALQGRYRGRGGGRYRGRGGGRGGGGGRNSYRGGNSYGGSNYNYSSTKAL
jgi:protein LSM14